MLRQPIIAVLGHVDHGKTSLLDKIRETAVASKEAGGITQEIGTTEIPAETITRICGHLIEKLKFELAVPGLLFIDTPGHEAFSTLRKRGGAIADLAILVVDINEGIMPQTSESIEILKETRTPFVIAMTKIDRIESWQFHDISFVTNYAMQSEEVKGIFEEKFYKVAEQFAMRNLPVERFDRITDFKKNVAAVPVCAKTGEGIPGLLTILVGLSQQFLKDKLLLSETAEGMVLEVKESTGLGFIIDSILYDGRLKKNDFLVIGGKSGVITKIRALLIPEPLRDMRKEKKFINIDEVGAAIGVRIVAPDMENVIAGSPFKSAKDSKEADQILDQFRKEVEEIEIVRDSEGVILKADTIGSLEALIKVFEKHKIKEATIGQITKTDILKAEADQDFAYRIIISFNSKISDEAKSLARDKNVKILHSDVIYRLIEDYDKWISQELASRKQVELDALVHPGKIKLIPGCVFRASNPAIVGCEVISGFVKPAYDLMNAEGKIVGSIKQIQSEGENVNEAKIGDKIAVSINGPVIGRQVAENEELFVSLGENDYRKIMLNEKFLKSHEKHVLEEIVAIKRRTNPSWGL